MASLTIEVRATIVSAQATGYHVMKHIMVHVALEQLEAVVRQTRLEISEGQSVIIAWPKFSGRPDAGHLRASNQIGESLVKYKKNVGLQL